MPALVDQPNVLKATFAFKVTEDANVVSRLFFAYTGTAPTNATCHTIANAMAAAWNNAFLADMVSSNTIESVTVEDLTTPTSGVSTFIDGQAGTAPAGTWLPAATCLLMNLHISRRYRGGKPRVYWPLYTSVILQDAQTWDPTTLASTTTSWQTNFLDVILGSVTDGCTITDQVSVSYYEGFTAVLNPITGRYKNVNKPRTVAIAPDVVTGFTLNPKPGIQRRRQLHSS